MDTFPTSLVLAQTPTIPRSPGDVLQPKILDSGYPASQRLPFPKLLRFEHRVRATTSSIYRPPSVTQINFVASITQIFADCR